MQVAERKRERERYTYVDVRYTCLVFGKYRVSRGRIAMYTERRIVLHNKSYPVERKLLAWHFGCVYASWKLVRSYARLESTELQIVEIHPKNAMLDYATLISFSVNITRTGPHCIPARSSRSTLSVLFLYPGSSTPIRYKP